MLYFKILREDDLGRMAELQQSFTACNPASCQLHFEDARLQDAVNEQEQKHDSISIKFIGDPPSFKSSLASNIGSTSPVLCPSLSTAAVIFREKAIFYPAFIKHA